MEIFLIIGDISEFISWHYYFFFFDGQFGSKNEFKIISFSRNINREQKLFVS